MVYWPSNLVSRQYLLKLYRARQPNCLYQSELNKNGDLVYPNTKWSNFCQKLNGRNTITRKKYSLVDNIYFLRSICKKKKLFIS